MKNTGFLMVAGGLSLAVAGMPANAQTATWNTVAPEKTFVYQGQPIHPNCIGSMVTNELQAEQPNVSLQLCQKPKTPAGRLTFAEENNGVFSANNRSRHGEDTGHVQYSVLAWRSTDFLLSVKWSALADGSVSDALLIVRKDNDELTPIKVVAIGNRCNGGLGEIHVTPTDVHYSANLTTVALLFLTGPTPFKIGHKLNTTVTACAGVSNIEYDLTSNRTRLTSVTLASDPISETIPLRGLPGASQKFPYQGCLNRYIAEQIRAGHKTLQPAEIKGFVQGFGQACVK
jgi:hypothetical protein